MALERVDVMDLTPEVFQDFVRKNALLTAGGREGYNTMTIGWGQLGSIWNEPVCTVYVRPERHTYGFMEESGYFTVSLIPAQRRDIARICGTKSGRDTDKAAECGLHVLYGAGDAPYFEEAEAVLVCKKLYAQDLDASHVTDGGPIDRFYGSAGKWHRMYIGQVVEAYVNK
ncbi:MAG: flavin reductase [Oscillibacter sp.]|nr:flavin reductase [Oscillibacter sp.]